MAGEDSPPGPELDTTLVVPPARTIAGKYQLGRMLGEGGMGSVYEAEHLGLGKKVAIKLLSESYTEEETFVKRFRREARALAAVTHDNIVQVMDTGTDEEGVPFIVMEILDGESLASFLRRERSVTPEQAADITGQVLAGLAAAHRKGVVHRDLKPANVFIALQEDGTHRVKILDFGISKFTADLTNMNVTAEGAVIGTPAYMSPEQVKGRSDVDLRSDVYAAGVMLYRMVTGKLPFAGKKPKEIYDKILRGMPGVPREIRADISEDLQAVILRAMALRPSERFQDAESFYEALRLAVPSLASTGPLAIVSRGSSASLTPPVSDTSPTRDVRARQALATPGTGRTNPFTGALTSRGGRRSFFLIGSLVVALIGAGVALTISAGLEDHVAPIPMPGVTGEDPALAFGAPALGYGVLRYTSQELIEADHQPLCDYLERTLQRPCDLQILENYELKDRLERGEIVLAALSASHYIPAKERHPDLRLIATGANAGGTSYVGVIFVKPSSGITTLDDLLGKEICYPSRESTSGYYYPRALLRQAGIDPDTAFRRESFHGASHVATLRALENGECDAAAVYQAAVQQAGFSPEEFHPLASTPRIQNDAYVLSGTVPDPDAREVADALLALEPDSTLAQQVLHNAYGPRATGQLRGFVPALDADYDDAREIIHFGDED